MTKTILVTGGAGFIGSHLSKRLLDLGHTVIIADNFFTGQKRNLLPLLDNKNLEVIRHDLCNPLFIETDEIYNLACPASPVHYQHNPIKTIKMGTVAMVNMLGLAKRTGARIVQASTSEVYGDPDIHPQVESYWGNVNPIGKRSCYDEGKRVAESLMFAYHWKCKVNIGIARIFNTYGPNMAKNDGRVISNFIIQALKGEDITIFGDGSQTRSFCYVDDMVDGLILLMEKGHFTGPVNLGNPGEFSILECAKMIIKLTGSKSKITHKPLPEDDPRQRRPDISLAKKELSWTPTIGFEEGLKKTISYFRDLEREEVRK